ncbi:MAG: tRNA (adenosine(37)-N6)-dimethylallyltransferase MiaA [Melioribacteraceae bacterium]|nr:tRNA (adenosine(37)-N6)-dimethylallyltransferase MiaA [Melioribacteraceae bacterium]
MNSKLITILGPTAVGKTKFAVSVAHIFNGEIISADSRQVYKFMDIGTGKDLYEYRIGDEKITYHLIDILEPSDEFNLYTFQRMFYNSYNEIISKSKTPFLVGGTGLYISSVIQNYKMTEVDFNSPRSIELNNFKEDHLRKLLLKLKPGQHNITDLNSKERLIRAIIIAEAEETETQFPEIDSLNLGITLKREEIKTRITERLKLRLKNGLIEEVEELINKGISYEKLNYFGLEYKYVGLYLSGSINYNDMYQKLNSAIHRFAKRQMTWFRKMEKEGTVINWLEPASVNKAEKLINEYLDN